MENEVLDWEPGLQYLAKTQDGKEVILDTANSYGAPLLNCECGAVWAYTTTKRTGKKTAVFKCEKCGKEVKLTLIAWRPACIVRGFFAFSLELSAEEAEKLNKITKRKNFSEGFNEGGYIEYTDEYVKEQEAWRKL